MPKKSVPASIREVAFDCPHCGAYTTHTWFVLYATGLYGDSRRPFIPDRDRLDEIRSDPQISDDLKRDLLQFFEKLLSGLILLEKKTESKWPDLDVRNLHISECFSCNQIALWVHDRLLFPAALGGPPPNPDLPDEMRLDYEEAGRILNFSPRSAAALLRLAIQKLCVVLGEKGKDLNNDIASLVRKGLSPIVQQALDTVRVIGNEAVHPGTLDLKDDRDTATKLFELVNLIAEQMISIPKHVQELYAKLPEAKRNAIDKRDEKP